MYDTIIPCMISFLTKKKIVSTRGAPQEMEANFRFLIHPHEIEISALKFIVIGTIQLYSFV